MRLLVSWVIFLCSSSWCNHVLWADPARTAADARQARFRAVSVSFSLKEIVKPGAISRSDPLFKAGKIVPAEETLLESLNKIVLDGSKVRLERNHPSFAMPSGQLLPQRTEAYFDGSIAKLYYPNGVANEGIGSGIIQRAPRQDATHEDLLLPLVCFLRPSDRSINPYPFANFKATGLTSRIGNMECLQYTIDLGPTARISAWLAPAKDYNICRIQHVSRGKISQQIDIIYQRGESNGWVLESWNQVKYSGDGTVLRFIRGHVVELLENSNHPSQYFDVVFAENSEVFDERNRTYYRVKADGTMREISLTGEELSSSVFQPGTRWYRRYLWLILAMGAVGICVGTGYLMRKRSRT